MSDKKRFIKSALTGTLCGILTSVVLTCAFALILSRSGMLGDNILGYASAGLLAAGAFLGGFVSAKLNRAAGLIAGAAAGAAMLALIVLVSAFMGYENTMNAYKVAVQEKYRFFSFGDSMCIL